MINRLVDRDMDASIHAIWEMDEYAKRGRIWVWLIPPIAPIMAFTKIILVISSIGQEVAMFDNMNSGGIFCQVLKIKSILHLMFVMMGGSHMWHGAAPIFIKIENRIPQVDISGYEDVMWIEIDKRRVAELIDWIRKYLTPDSIS